ncbi:hypothetical protein [Allohahella sp. A8]|uniref:hypothetical protein n=1 Tax=Allohahella sp. A8 TaxID=3141461 RepID=UPI003A8091CD
MKKVLDIIDSALKRLLAPVSMLVAAGLLSRGLENPDASPFTIKLLMSLLGLWAFGYMALSAVVALKEFEDAGFGKVKSFIFGSSFLLVYLLLFVAAIRLGFDKIA